MKAIFWVVGVALLASVCLTGCDERALTVPTDPSLVSPADAQRVLAFSYTNTLSTGDFYHITLQNIGGVSTGFPKDINTDSVEVSIGDSTVTLYYVDMIPFFTGWISEDAHLLRSTQNVKLKINGVNVLNSTVKKVNKANAAFPNDYDYTQQLNLNWSVASGNQYQFVKAEVFDEPDPGEFGAWDSYIKKVAPYARNYIFPANCITPPNPPFTLVLTVEEINYFIAGKTAVMVYQNESSGYGSGSRKADIFNPFEIVNQIRNSSL